jgi:hypothetical protein
LLMLCLSIVPVDPEVSGIALQVQYDVIWLGANLNFTEL